MAEPFGAATSTRQVISSELDRSFTAVLEVTWDEDAEGSAEDVGRDAASLQDSLCIRV